MHIVIGIVAGSLLGVLVGSAAVQMVTPPAVTVQANEAPMLVIPNNRVFDI